MQAIPQVAPLVQAAAQGRGGKFAFISSDMARIGEVASTSRAIEPSPLWGEGRVRGMPVQQERAA